MNLTLELTATRNSHPTFSVSRSTNVRVNLPLSTDTLENELDMLEVMVWAETSLRRFLRKKGFRFLRPTAISFSENSTNTTQVFTEYSKHTLRNRLGTQESFATYGPSSASGSSLGCIRIGTTQKSSARLTRTFRKAP